MKALLFPMINFIIFCGILFCVLKKPVRDLFQSRSKEIEKNIEDAKIAYHEARAGFDRAEERIHRLEDEKKKLEHDAERQIEILRKRMKEAIGEWVLKIKAEYEQRSHDELKLIIDELKVEISERLIQMAEKIMREKLTPELQGKLIQDALAEAAINERNLRKETSWLNESQSVMQEPS